VRKGKEGKRRVTFLFPRPIRREERKGGGEKSFEGKRKNREPRLFFITTFTRGKKERKGTKKGKKESGGTLPPGEGQGENLWRKKKDPAGQLPVNTYADRE